MKKIKVLLFFLFLLIFSLLTAREVFAEEKKSFITIVNPVRIAPYTLNSKETIEAQYFEISKKNLPATWLLTYDVIENNESSEFVKNEFNSDQELGIFMEVSSASAKAAGVQYNKTDSWYRSNSIFLSGYSQADRIKLIDKVFERFKNKFGYYPVSVGAWWIDSFSLDYMSKKYKITANLSCADQLDTDGYNIWGTYWSSPYYPSKHHAGMPAGSLKDKLDLVTIQWAPRDPLNGYISPDSKNRASLYSTQDYSGLGLGDTYFEKLLKFYTSEDFDQISIGLEGEFAQDSYSGIYATQLDLVRKISAEGSVFPTTMKEFSKQYRKKYTSLTPEKIIETDDLLGGNKKAVWFQNPNYRLGMVYDHESKQAEIIDLKAYYNNFPEPFYVSPNKQYHLFSVLPSIIDKRVSGTNSMKLNLGEFIEMKKNNTGSSIEFEKGKINLGDNSIEIIGARLSVDQRLLDLGLLQREGNKIIIPDKYIVPEGGFTFKEFNPKIPFAIRYRLSPEIKIFAIAGIVLITGVSIYILLTRGKKYIFIVIPLAVLGLTIYLFARFNSPVYVSQSEIDALIFLENLKEGKVLVFDKDCLKCSWSSENKPAAMENRKSYVEKFSKKQIIYSLDFVLARNPDEAKKVLKKENPRYLYLAKYEDYIEALSFDPNDIGVRKIYENANAVIYEVL